MSLISGIETNKLEEVKNALAKNKRNYFKYSKSYDMSIFEIAIHNDAVEIVQFFFNNQQKYKLTFPDTRSRNSASLYGLVKSVEMAETLLKFGIPINNGMSNTSVLVDQLKMGWTNNEKEDIIQWLIDNGEDPNDFDSSDWSPLMIACSGNHLEIMDILVKVDKYYNRMMELGIEAALPQEIKDIFVF